MLQKIKNLKDAKVEITITYTDREKRSVGRFLLSAMRTVFGASLVVDSYQLMKDAQRVNETRSTIQDLEVVKNVMNPNDVDMKNAIISEEIISSSSNYDAEKKMATSSKKYSTSKILNDAMNPDGGKKQ